MHCTYTLTIASIKMFVRNRQALFFSLFMPTIILFIFGSIDFDKPSRMRIGLVTHTPSAATARFVDKLRSLDVLATTEGPLQSELTELNAGNRTAVLDIPDDLISPEKAGDPTPLPVYVNAGRPLEAATAMSVLNQVADHVALSAARAPALFTIQQQAVNSHHVRYIEFLLPGVMAMAIMQMSVFSVAFVFTLYKQQGILKRLLATPMRPRQFVTANILTRLVMACAQAALFVALGMGEFHVHIAGAFWLLAVCVVLGSLMFLGLGFTISGLSKTIETVPLLANIVVFPMLFVGNVFFSVSNMPPWLGAIAGYLPLTYLSTAMRGVMTDGAGLMQIKGDLIGMTVWSVVLVALAVFTFSLQDNEAA
jgi:ABC-2 type transport system permease protein